MRLALLVCVLALASSSMPAQARMARPEILPVCKAAETSSEPFSVEDVLGLDLGPPQSSEAGLRQLLVRSPWPTYLWDEVTQIVECESQYQQDAIGDQGRAFGLMQIRVDFHPRLAGSYDLLDGGDNLAAAYVVFLEARSFKPWSCWKGN
mgnify:CR=1 FL=1